MRNDVLALGVLSAGVARADGMGGAVVVAAFLGVIGATVIGASLLTALWLWLGARHREREGLPREGHRSAAAGALFIAVCFGVMSLVVFFPAIEPMLRELGGALVGLAFAAVFIALVVWVVSRFARDEVQP